MRVLVISKKTFYFIFLGLIFLCNALQAKEQPGFYFSNLSDTYCNQLISEKVITEFNPVPCSRLSKVNFSYINEQGNIAEDGVLVVLDILAPKVEDIMKLLLKQKFVIDKAQPIEKYHGDDNASMSDNNTSAFNGRAITGGSRWSLHAYGAAIDINPIQNPFIEINEDGTAKISPEKSARYALNRLNQRPGKTPRAGMAEEVVDIFAEHGFFVWGGYWNYPIDYQHFQVGPRSFIDALVAVPADQGKKLLDKYISIYANCRKNNLAIGGLEKQRSQCLESVISEMP